MCASDQVSSELLLYYNSNDRQQRSEQGRLQRTRASITFHMAHSMLVQPPFPLSVLGNPALGSVPASFSPVFRGVDVGQVNRAVAVDDVDIRLW